MIFAMQLSLSQHRPSVILSLRVTYDLCLHSCKFSNGFRSSPGIKTQCDIRFHTFCQTRLKGALLPSHNRSRLAISKHAESMAVLHDSFPLSAFPKSSIMESLVWLLFLIKQCALPVMASPTTNLDMISDLAPAPAQPMLGKLFRKRCFCPVLSASVLLGTQNLYLVFSSFRPNIAYFGVWVPLDPGQSSRWLHAFCTPLRRECPQD